jgi:hypothetical protein
MPENNKPYQFGMIAVTVLLSILAVYAWMDSQIKPIHLSMQKQEETDNRLRADMAKLLTVKEQFNEVQTKNDMACQRLEVLEEWQKFWYREVKPVIDRHDERIQFLEMNVFHSKVNLNHSRYNLGKDK